MKKIFLCQGKAFAVIMLAIIFFVTWYCQGAAAKGAKDEKVIEAEFRLDPAELVFGQEAGKDTVTFPKSIFMRLAGAPRLPVKVMHVALDPDKDISKIEVVTGDPVEIEGTFDLYPAQKTIRYGQKREPTPQDPAIYASSQAFPKEKYKFKKQGYLSGVSLATFDLYPVEYLPQQKKIRVFTSIKLVITQKKGASGFAPKPKKVHLRRSKKGKDLMKAWASTLVINSEEVPAQFEDVSDDAAGFAPQSGPIDYLIITSNALRESGVLQPLIDSKTVRGLVVLVETVEDITATIAGRDAPEKIRNYIIQAGPTWVLLFGDSTIVPVRYKANDPFPEEDFFASDEAAELGVPSDMYYSCLEGDWDANANDAFGEMEDVPDLYPDVFVGRAPVEDESEAVAFVDKVLTYETNISSYYDRALLFGCEDFEDAGGRVNDMIEGEIMSELFRPAVRYNERETPIYPTEAWDEMNTGPFNLINHIDHGDTGMLYFGGNSEPLIKTYLTTDDINALTNQDAPSILTSCACWPAAFDLDALAEHWLTNANGGGAAFVGNSRYGLSPESDFGLVTEFYRSLFGREVTQIGQTLADAKMMFIGEAQQSISMLYAMTEFNLLGDPEMNIMINPAGILTHPGENSVVEGQVEISGSTPLETSYNLYYAPADTPLSRILIASSSQPVSDGLLGSWDTTAGSVTDGWYILSLDVILANGYVMSTTRRVYVNNNHANLPPMFTPVRNKSVAEGETVAFTVYAADPEGGAVTLSAEMEDGQSVTSIGAVFNDNGDGTGSFAWVTDQAQIQIDYQVVFRAVDGQANVSLEPVTIHVQRQQRIYDPVPGTTITETEVSFRWVGGSGSQYYGVCVAEDGQDGQDVHCSVPSQETFTSFLVPLNGLPWEVTLWSLSMDGDQVIDANLLAEYTYPKAVAEAARITEPDPESGMPLSNSTQTFEWERGVGCREYGLCFSKDSDLAHAQCTDPMLGLTTTLQNIPIDNQPVYVRLYSRVGPDWLFRDYEYSTVVDTHPPVIQDAVLNPAGRTYLSGVGLSLRVRVTDPNNNIASVEVQEVQGQNLVPLPSWMRPYFNIVRPNIGYLIFAGTLPNVGQDIVYTLRVTAQDTAMNTTTQDLTFTVLAYDPPATPQGLTAVAQSHAEIQLDWSTVAGAIDYALYRNNVYIGKVSTNSYLDSGLQASTTYAYAVRAINAAGYWSEFSDTLSETTMPSPIQPSPSPIALHSRVYVTNPCGADMLEDAYVGEDVVNHIPAGAPLQVMNSPQGYYTTQEDGYTWWYVWIDDTRYFPYDFGGWMKGTDLSTLAPTQPMSCPSPSPSPSPETSP